MKIKFPFFSKKFPWVCTTDQVVHQVDGKDKKLSDMLNSIGNGVPITFNGEAPMEQFKKGLYGVPALVGGIKQIIDEFGLSYLYANTSIDVEFKKSLNFATEIFINKLFGYINTMDVESDGTDSIVVVGEGIINQDDPEYSEELHTYIVNVVGNKLIQMLQSQDAEDMQAIIDYIHA